MPARTPDATRAKIKRLHAEGLRNVMIAELTGVSETTVGNIVGRKRRLPRITQSQAQLAQELTSKGVRQKKAAEKSGMSEFTVRSIAVLPEICQHIEAGFTPEELLAGFPSFPTQVRALLFAWNRWVSEKNGRPQQE